MKVIIAGEHPFVMQLGDYCKKAGHDTDFYLIEDFYDAIESGFVIERLSSADVVIDLHHESPEAKEELLMSIGRALRPEALLLTSALPISTTQAGAWVADPSQVVGFGILPPLENNELVELAKGFRTSPAAFQKAEAFWRELGFATAEVSDGAGLVRARMIGLLVNEAVCMLQENIASPQVIDQIIRKGTDLPFGPLEWADFLGLDTVLGMMQGLFKERQEPRYRPAPLLKRMVLAGKLGRKVGEGFFKYTNS